MPPVPSARQSPTAQLGVVRYTDAPLSEYTATVMNEATKLSYACRYFRCLYGRWPSSIREIESRTEGIDFGVFPGKAFLVPRPDDTEEITVYDGVCYRMVIAVPVAFPITDQMRAEARKAEFKIRIDRLVSNE